MKKLKHFKYETKAVEEQMHMLWISNQGKWQFLGFIDNERLNGLEGELKIMGDKILEENNDFMNAMMTSFTGDEVSIHDALYVAVPVFSRIAMF